MFYHQSGLTKLNMSTFTITLMWVQLALYYQYLTNIIFDIVKITFIDYKKHFIDPLNKD